ncbi:N-acetyl-alpha-D-glucosaminyl L-malate synthase BshA [Taibaiella chishuiensis]|uniref:N-acetyl-alpha-D-glucosaminyl L-malate synthase BshA n=1 Tax=Taibaiella chishuiensis TaxID=1434707 RepID=A0A2P8CVP7_9BACT|nr:N-acetyl-alpha-D-glucosaminyl L-malate synthase BshA [Taibaiella chishuiensis]PSK89048.1 N-acetyl-alpha-D-glucosaminyl L-malate synthase BshA [Taibaiella chishuiensis]
MKIGIVCYPTFGGSGVMATELGLALADKGHEIHFITYQQPVRLNVFRPNIYYHEVIVPKYPLFDFPPYETALASTLVNVVNNNQLDLLHVHYAIPHASSAYFARQMLKKQGKDIPFITTLHGTDITLVGKDSTYGCVVTFSINESDAITAVSENLREETFKSFAIDKEISVVPNFVDAQRFHLTNKEHFKKMLAPAGERILAHVSNFRKVKRVEDVLAIFEQVRSHMPSKLLMIGDGPERQNAEDLCRKMGIADDIRFLGKQDQMEEILNIADVFLLPSQYESFGLAALEAMACGVPVISSNAGGLPEINIHNQTGFLADVGDVKTMAAHTVYLLEHEERLQQFKEQALAHAANFSIDKIVPMYENLYRQVTANRHVPIV